MQSFRFPSATVTFGFVAVPVIVGILKLWARSETGMVVFDVTDPTMAFTPCWLMRRFAALLASVGSFLSSTSKVAIFMPATPPLAFASSTATSKAFFTDSPNVLTSPESGVIRPILISFAGGDLQPGKCPTRRTTSARSDNPLLTFLLHSSMGLAVSALQFYARILRPPTGFYRKNQAKKTPSLRGEAAIPQFRGPPFPLPSCRT